MINEIQELLAALDDILLSPQPIAGWVNGSLYQPTNEVLGVLPIPDNVRFKSEMAPFDPSPNPKQPHRHLALLQGTRKAVLPIHNDAEKKLFKEFMCGHQSFGNFKSATQVTAAVRAWNAGADTDKDIYYKVSFVRAAFQIYSYLRRSWENNSRFIITTIGRGIQTSYRQR
jgi:hypothetical protein